MNKSILGIAANETETWYDHMPLQATYRLIPWSRVPDEKLQLLV